MSRFIRERYSKYDAYTPGEQPKDGEFIKLNTNESPYSPGAKVLDAIGRADLAGLRLYPSPTQDELKEAIALKLSEEAVGISLTKENICVSNGSDDILNFAFTAFCDDERPAVFPDISYGFYEVFADFHGVGKKIIPLTEDFRIDPSEYVGEKGLIAIANPNAPTGITLNLDEIETIIKANPDAVVMVDEAYVDFGGESAAVLIDKYENLLVVRTFSKSYSLAGARLGFAAGPKALIEDLELMKYSTNPYSINKMTELVGLAALQEPEYYMNNCNKVKETRDWTKRELERIGYYVLESNANFLFVKTGEGFYEKLKEKGVLVRWFNKERIKDFVRVSIGTQEDMEAFIKAAEAIGG